MYTRIGGATGTGALLAVTGSNVPFAAYFIAAAVLLFTGLILIRVSYLGRTGAGRHAVGVGGPESPREVGPSGPAPRGRHRGEGKESR